MRGGKRMGYWNQPKPTDVECAGCGAVFDWNRNGSGPRPMYCGAACKQRAYRQRIAARRLADRVEGRLAEDRHG